MEYRGNLRKMISTYEGPERVVQYELPADGKVVHVNELAGHDIRLEYDHEIHCIHCGRHTQRSYFQGYCYPCFITLPQTDDCILRPERCRAHLGESRDMEWSRQHCLQDHFVYLALTTDTKVGVTRASQVPVRWIDQGAWKAIQIARTPNRHLAGTIEVALKKHLTDRTDWRKMLRLEGDARVDLQKEKEKIYPFIPEKLKKYYLEERSVWEFKYPLERYPQKVSPVNLNMQDVVEGILLGIKGQYWIFEDGKVLNIRKHGGYRFRLKIL